MAFILLAACGATHAGSGSGSAPQCATGASLVGVTPVVETSAQTALCDGSAYEAPIPTCDWHCLVELQEGSAPTALYAEQQGSGYWLQGILAVTDDFVLATATWGPYPISGGNWDTWGLVEVPTDGRAPVMVDTFAATSGVTTSAVAGDDGYLYYAWVVDPASTNPVTLARISLTALGAARQAIATGPSARLGAALVVDAGYLYVGTDAGISRVPVSGGAVTNIVADSSGAFEQPGAFAVYAGTIYAPVDGLLAAIPGAGGAPRSLAIPAAQVAIGGCPVAAYVASPTLSDAPSTVSRVELAGGTPTMILSSASDLLELLGFSGDRLYLAELCRATEPELPGGGFTRYFDTTTATVGQLAAAPSYPFLAAPTGFAHDPAGTTLYYLY